MLAIQKIELYRGKTLNLVETGRRTFRFKVHTEDTDGESMRMAEYLQARGFERILDWEYMTAKPTSSQYILTTVNEYLAENEWANKYILEMTIRSDNAEIRASRYVEWSVRTEKQCGGKEHLKRSAAKEDEKSQPPQSARGEAPEQTKRKKSVWILMQGPTVNPSYAKERNKIRAYMTRSGFYRRHRNFVSYDELSYAEAYNRIEKLFESMPELLRNVIKVTVKDTHTKVEITRGMLERKDYPETA